MVQAEGLLGADPGAKGEEASLVDVGAIEVT
jgi:hypothetical protein